MRQSTVAMSRRRDAARASDADARRIQLIAAALVSAACLAGVALWSLPVLREASAALGAAPLWLVAMPLASLSALLAAHRVDRPLSRRRTPDSSPVVRRLRPGIGLPARRRAAATHQARPMRAA